MGSKITGHKRGTRLQNVDGLIGQSSLVQTASGLIYTGQVLILGVKGNTDDVNDLTLTVYDNTQATGTAWDKFFIPKEDGYGGGFYPCPMIMENGIYVQMSSGSHSYIVFYAEISEN